MIVANFVNGTSVSVAQTSPVVDPATGKEFGRAVVSRAAEVDAAVQAAADAFPAWSRTTPEERAKVLTRIGEGLAARMDEIATVITREAGMPKWLSTLVQAGLPINSFNTAAQLAESYEYESQLGNSLVVREPVGVVGAITPWNYPLHQIAAKVAYAIAAGCTVVLKPSEVAPLDAFILAEVIHDAGLPAGVFNLVMGRGSVLGELLSRSAEVDAVSFTGSVAVGRGVAQNCAARLAKVQLEMGGKNPLVVLEDADLALAVESTLQGAFGSTGQRCTATSRAVVVESVADEFVRRLTERTAQLKVGDGSKPGTNVGPSVDESQFNTVLRYLEIGQKEGARLVIGGKRLQGGDYDRGYFV
ncbi:MAG: aldehyde dehydrogenase family protein, partial [Acidimicrobiales bacterium]